jgi:hypothetical protein
LINGKSKQKYRSAGKKARKAQMRELMKGLGIEDMSDIEANIKEIYVLSVFPTQPSAELSAN